MGSRFLRSSQASASPRVRSDVVTRLSQDRGVQAYSKWGGAFWRLISLVDLGVTEGHRGALAAAEAALEWASSPRRLAEIHRRRIDGRVRRCASQEGQVLRCCLAIGLRGDPRLVERRVGDVRLAVAIPAAVGPLRLDERLGDCVEPWVTSEPESETTAQHLSFL